MTLVSTALGALIALLATMLNERFKWRREQTTSRRKLCHDTYAGFLSALTDAHERMRGESLAEHASTQARAAAVRDAFLSAGCYQLRYQLAIVAGQDVVDGAEAAFFIMRDVRDLFADGHSVDSTEYVELRKTYGTSLRELQGRMRTELDAGHVHLAGGS
jgi:hypothetical protein